MTMATLTLESLKELDDGRVQAAFMHELRRAVKDCMDRPGDKTAREVSLVFKLTPIVGEEGMCEGADGDFHIKSKVPTRKTKTYNFRTNTRGDLIYSSNSPDNADQLTFGDVNPESGKVER